MKGPKAIEIRSYQVGFGDCFLLSFVYGERDKRHVLVDFGTTGLAPKQHKKKGAAAAPAPKKKPAGPRPSEHMPKVAEAIRAVCAASSDDPRLTAVVVTHRHADHISGFATDGDSGGSGKVIAALRPRVVIQSWTEDPRAEKEAKSATTGASRTRPGMVAGLAAMNRVAGLLAEWSNTRAARGLTAATRNQLEFLGMDNIRNKSAVDNLIAMGHAKGSRPVYAKYGDDLRLSRLLPGVKVTCLGPPDLTMTQTITRMRKRDPDQYWHLLAASPDLVGVGLAAAAKGAGAPAKLPPEARWFRERLDRARNQSLLQIVRSLDDQMNNTSLILLFEAGGKKLLFPGDAQIENWLWALEESPEHEANRALLADVDVYKVGHHGSLNATPKALLWEKFAKRGAQTGKRMRALISTMKGMHGDRRSKTEVPRKTLLDALEAETDLNNTEEYAKGVLLGRPLVIEL